MKCWIGFFSLVFGISVWAAEKPSYIVEDPQANKFQKINARDLQKKFGNELANFMLGLRPANAVNGTGKLRIRPPKGKRIELALTFRTFAVGQRLISEYATKLGVLTVTKQPKAPTEYLWAPPLGKPQQLTGRQAEQPFAGSDFWMADLGLEFLHWPNQRLLNRRLRRGELCSVLESVPKPGGKYSKIVSYVDEDSMGIVHADAFDMQGKLLKQFAPKSFKKIGKQWHLREMEMRNEQADSRTAIFFDLKQAGAKKPAGKK